MKATPWIAILVALGIGVCAVAQTTSSQSSQSSSQSGPGWGTASGSASASGTARAGGSASGGASGWDGRSGSGSAFGRSGGTSSGNVTHSVTWRLIVGRDANSAETDRRNDAYVAKFHQAGKVFWSGKFKHTPGGITLLANMSDEEAAGFVENAPSVKAGLYEPELKAIQTHLDSFGGFGNGMTTTGSSRGGSGR